ncbi:MAG: hypothetical protein LBC94_01060, partial [Desulfovibrio sp.]|nr:hypothetical protein [Desulfovibrio sp.]
MSNIELSLALSQKEKRRATDHKTQPSVEREFFGNKTGKLREYSGKRREFQAISVRFPCKRHIPRQMYFQS